MTSASQSTMYENMDPNNGYDGNTTSYPWSTFKNRCVHTHNQDNVKQWWKVRFKQRVLLTRVHFYNRGKCCWGRSSHLLIKALLTENGVTSDIICANTGDMDSIVDKIFQCRLQRTPADELMILDTKNNNALNFCEVIAYGFVL